MPLEPDDIVRKSFKTSLFKRGYDESDVDTFLEEIYRELRRLHGQIDELEAARARPLSLQQLDEEVESERVLRERQQLQQIRTERSELVAELEGIQERADRARAETDAANQRVVEAEEAAAAAEERREAAAAAESAMLSRLQKLTHDHEVLSGSHDGLVRELRRLRLAAETSALEVLGSYDPATLELKGADQEDDIAIISTIAAQLHDGHVERGRAGGERLRALGQAAADEVRADAEEVAARLIQEARAQHDELLAEGQSEYEGLVEAGRSQRDTLLEEARAQQASLVAEGSRAREEGRARWEELVGSAQAEHKRLLDEGTSEHQRLVSEAEQQRAGILADLNARRELLETRVAELDRSQAEYRDRLRALVQQQLAALDDDGWRGATTAALDVEARR